MAESDNTEKVPMTRASMVLLETYHSRSAKNKTFTSAYQQQDALSQKLPAKQSKFRCNKCVLQSTQKLHSGQRQRYALRRKVHVKS